MNRWDWVDRAKGLGIVLVVIGHVLRGLVEGRLVPAGGLAAAVDYTLYTFHMPLFFLLAGLFVEPSLRKGAERFWRSKLLTIAYPYFLWSVLHGSLLLLFSGITNSAGSVSRIASILWLPISPFWFLYSLFLCHALYALLRRFDARLVLALSAGVFVLLEWFRSGSHDVNLIWDTGRGFFFYLLGVWLAERRTLPFPRPGMALAIAAIAFPAAVLLCWSAGLVYEAALPAAIAGMALVLALAHIITRDGGLFILLGRHSMPILVMHVMIAAGIRIALVRLTPLRDPALLLLLGTLAGLIIPVVVSLVAQRLGLSRWLGFPGEEKAAPPVSSSH